MSETRLHAIVSGRVQGVGYRNHALEAALRLNLRGMVRNLGAGQVEVVAEGARGELEQLLAALREGPPAARVTHVQVSWAEAQGGMRSFTVRPSA